MEETKKHDWNRIIEDVFQCPVCLRFTESSYIVCERGHYMCSYCIKQVTKCPMCYSLCMVKPIKHLAADDLMSRLAEIQLSIEEDIKTATRKVQKHKSVQTDGLITKSSITQTDEIKCLIAKSSVYTQTKNVPTTNNNKNINYYQCLIGCCPFNAPYETFVKHLRHCHVSSLEEHSSMERYQKMFLVPRHKLPWDHEYVIIFHQRGVKRIYFVNFLIRSSGSLKCCVTYNKFYILPTIPQYSITFPNEPNLKFTGEVKPSSIQIENRYDLCFSEKEMSAKLQADSIRFTFTCS